MSIKVAKSRFIHSSIEILAKLHLAKSTSDFHQLGSCLVLESEKAQALRQTERLQELSFILSRIPIKEYQLIGQFYKCRSKPTLNSRKLLEEVIEKSDTYKSKALIALGTLEVNSGDDRSGLKLYAEAMRLSYNPSITLHAARSIAVVKGMDGLHYHSIKDLERIAPLAQYSSPVARYQYLNSLAVELGSVGKIEEASNVCQVVLASPYISAYPEWRETANEIALKGYKSRSAIPVIESFLEPKNLARLPVPEFKSDSTQTKPAKILSYLDWKNNMVKEPNSKEDDENIDEMDEKDLLATLIQLAAQEDIDQEKLRDVVKYAIKTLTRPKK